MSDDMIKRVKKAMEISSGNHAVDWEGEARAAIEAMREPSQEVLDRLEYLLDTQGHHQTLKASWSMLIDAALGVRTHE